MVQDLRHPADTNWGVRLDLVYDIKSRSHPRKLTEEQQLDQQDEPRTHKPDRADLTPSPSGQLYQRTGDRNLQSYRKISSKVKSTCNHKIILNNGVLLRKSAITVSRKPAKKVPASFPQTPTLKAIKQKELAIKKTKTDTVKSTLRTLKKYRKARKPPIPKDLRVEKRSHTNRWNNQYRWNSQQRKRTYNLTNSNGSSGVGAEG